MSAAYDPFDNIAVDRTIGTLDEPPEDAARAIELGQKTGASPVAIHADLEEFENNAKAATTAQLIRGNRHISDYINSHPLAGIVSNGDLHNLDEASGKMKVLPKGRSAVEKDFGETAGSLAVQWGQNLFDAVWESGKSLASIPKDWDKHTIPSDEVRQAADLVRQEGPNYHNISQFLGTLNNLFVTQIAGGDPLNPAAQFKPVNLGAQDLVGGLVGAFGAVTGLTPTVRLFAQVGQESTSVPAEFSEQVAMLGMMFMGLRHGKAHSFAGEVPPPGLSKEVDAIREHRSKENLRALDEATKSVQGTKTNQLSPELAREFAGQHVEDRSVYVSVDAVRKLYGDKPPKSDDGLLGWVDNLGEQIAANVDVGKDISIPLKDWLTKIDPEVMKVLHDDIRVTKDDVTTNEAKRFKELSEAKETIKELQGLENEQAKAIEEKNKAVETFGAESPEATAAFDKIDEITKKHGEANERLKGQQIPSPQPIQGAENNLPQRIQQAYLDLTKGKWDERVFLKDLREKLGDIDSKELNSALKDLAAKDPNFGLFGLDNPRQLTKDISVGALDILGNPRHLVRIRGPRVPQGAGGPDMSRRGFLKGAGATVAAAATGKVGKVAEVATNPFVGADLGAFAKNVEFEAAKQWEWFEYLHGGYNPQLTAKEPGFADSIRRHVLDHVEGALKTVKLHQEGKADPQSVITGTASRALENSKFYEAVVEKLKSGWTPPPELIKQIREGANAEAVKYNQEAQKLKEQGKAKEAEEIKDVERAYQDEPDLLPPLEEYMKAGYPKGITEPGPRSSVRRHQEAVDETRSAAKLHPILPQDPKGVRLQITDVNEVNKFTDQAGKEHSAGVMHDININDVNGKYLGWVSAILEDAGKKLYIDNMMSATGEPWSLGMGSSGVFAHAFHELHVMFPDIESVAGWHISGAGEPKYREIPIKQIQEMLGAPQKARSGIPKDFKIGKPESFRATTQDSKLFEGKSVGSLSLRDALRQIDFDADMHLQGPITGALNTISRAIIDKAGTTRVHFVKDNEFNAMIQDKGYAAFHDANFDSMVLPESALEHGFLAQDLLHESVHAATSKLIYDSPAFSLKIQSIMDHVSGQAYGLKDPHEFLAEAISNPTFQKKLANTPIPAELARELGLPEKSFVKTMWDAILAQINKFLTGKDGQEYVSALEAAIRVTQEGVEHRFSFAERLRHAEYRAHWAKTMERLEVPQGAEERIPESAQPTAFTSPKPPQGAAPKQLELPGMTRVEDRKAFATPAAVGITKEWYQKYQDLIAKQQGEDAKRQMEIALRRAEQIQTKEWKDTQDRISKEVEDQLRARPDVAVDEALRRGSLGEGTARLGGRRLRLNAKELTEEQKGVLDKSEYSNDGVHPDDLANFYGYPSGDAMLERLGQFREFVKETYASTEAFIKAASREETAKRMEQEFGDLGQKILEEARDHVLSETQLDLMHEELVGLAMQAGVELSITKEQMKALAKNSFDKHTMANLSTAEYLRLAGKHGLELEKAMLDQDWKTAFKAKQMQTLATMMAQEAKKIEKAKKVWDRNVKRFAKREVSGIDQRYTNAIHDIMFRTGSTPRPRRTPSDLSESFRLDGWSDISPLKDFVADRMEAFRELAVPDWLQDPRFEKDFDSLTAKEFREAHDAMRSLIKNGRDEQKVFSEGNAADLKEVFSGMFEQIKDLPIQEDRIDRPQGRIAKWIGTSFWAHVNLESMMNRLDRGQIGGLFKKYIMRPIAEASNAKDAMMKKYQGQVADLGKIKDMDKLVENTLFIDPRGDGKPFIMRKRNVLGVLQNVGNVSNLEKLAKGYEVSPENIMAWLKKNTTPEDWDRAQKIGKIFDDLFAQGARMQHELTGVQPVKVPLQPFIDPFGTVREGWYNPVKYDRKRPGNSPRLIGRSALEDEGYFRATVPTGFLTERTGYIAPMELNLDIVPVRMRQMIHDITMRPSVIQASKFFYNPEFNRMIREYYGDKPVEEFVPFLRDVANSPNFVSFAEQTGNQAMEFFRQNLISTLIGLNPGTVMKHGTTALLNSLQQMGYRDFAREFAGMVRDLPIDRRNWRMAMEKSEELQRRRRNFSEIIAGHGSEISIRGGTGGGTFDTARQVMMQFGATPVAASDLLSAVPTWLVAYKRARMEGATEGEAVYRGDLAIRQTHGSSVMSNKPSIMRTNAFGTLYTSLYGFFSHMFQKQYEMAWKAKDAMGLAKEGEKLEAAKRLPELASLFLSYVILPAIIEELVTPYTNSERDSWGKKIAKTLAFGVGSSMIGVRDFVHGFVNVRDPSAGLVGTMFKTISDVGKDLGRGSQAFTDPARQAKLVNHVLSMFGLLTGLTNASEGKAVEYLWRVNKGLEKPKGPWEVGAGLRYGTTKGHSKTIGQYMEHMKGH